MSGPWELEIGTNGKGDVVIVHPDIDPDKDGVGHIVFSPLQARHLASVLLKMANRAEEESVKQ